MIDEDLQKFSESRVMRTIAIGRVPIRNLPKKLQLDRCLLLTRRSSGKLSISVPEAPGSKPDSTENSPCMWAYAEQYVVVQTLFRWCGAEVWRGWCASPDTVLVI
ncbi:hypothetical protein AVEN_193083-1 [Araneus ventricosus]|uniref:Uncharacterized protein n=1 Tax=Araneus ventricosus TaxID=182803 RepID=A0A4Y2B0K6_ARAVE|nr:hypothetical protein AVEN_193083-1 [Araneus ventricosus]